MAQAFEKRSRLQAAPDAAARAYAARTPSGVGTWSPKNSAALTASEAQQREASPARLPVNKSTFDVRFLLNSEFRGV